ncbi:SURF1 family protein [Nonomuraea africana]|uniref:SURF1-like protein n=1 Tax=Nonomuraea africana TaxID=46171 RepID=A0ABR9KRZ1_9ACTN|nr:SURF1 family protein [Nonomuraea africana]MBE1564297.1 cytochrome oxidase assembly protein ShyY1 [Nonomuraea africana]
MYRFLLTPRWLALHVVVLLVIPAFVFLGQWQFGRYEERSANSDVVTRNLNAKPVPIGELVAPGQDVDHRDRYRSVTIQGSYDPAQSLLVRRRTQNSQLGFYVLTPMVTGEGQAVLVNRGWVKAGATADALPEVPPAPPGRVSVTGMLRPSETEASSGIRNRGQLPPGQVLLINIDAIGKGLPYELVGGYVSLTEQRPATSPAPEPVPPPDVGAGGGLNFAYGIQWWLFIGVAVGGWLLMIRREVKDRSAEQRAETDEAEPADQGQEQRHQAAAPSVET